jgi:uncharacterized protein (DUF849 family)
MAKVIIEAAINGNAAAQPHIGYSPEEIGNDAIATCKAGAAIIHFHVRDPETGKWVHDVPTIPGLSTLACGLQGDALADLSDGRRRRKTFQPFRRTREGSATKPDFGAGDMGSVNLVAYDPAAKSYTARIPSIKTPTDDSLFPHDVARAEAAPDAPNFRSEFPEGGTHISRSGHLTKPLMLKFYLGGPELPFGLPPSLKSLEPISTC